MRRLGASESGIEFCKPNWGQFCVYFAILVWNHCQIVVLHAQCLCIEYWSIVAGRDLSWVLGFFIDRTTLFGSTLFDLYEMEFMKMLMIQLCLTISADHQTALASIAYNHTENTLTEILEAIKRGLTFMENEVGSVNLDAIIGTRDCRRWVWHRLCLINSNIEINVRKPSDSFVTRDIPEINHYFVIYITIL